MPDGTSWDVAEAGNPEGGNPDGGTEGGIDSGQGAGDASDGAPVGDDGGDSGPALHSVGGTVTGLAAGNNVIIQNNGGDNLTVSGNGNFTFATKLAAGSRYAVSVLGQPSTPTQSCTVNNPSGPVAAADITTVVIVCVTTSYTVGGHLHGLTAGGSIVLLNNSGDDLTVTQTGVFTFATPVPSGSVYDVSIKTQPIGQVCHLAGGHGVVGGGKVTGVVVNCSPNLYSIGGQITGLNGTVALLNNGGDALAVTSNGSFAFQTPLATGQMYNVTVSSNPSSPISQTCTVTANDHGTVANMPITDVTVVCVTNSFTVGGTLTGLAAGDSIMLQNGGATITLNADGIFAFTPGQPSGTSFNVTSSSQPTGPVVQTCTPTANTGTIGNANVTSVLVTCVTKPASVGGSLNGLTAGSRVVLQNNGGDNLTLTANGAFTFATKVANGSPYGVTVFTQPGSQTSMPQLCNVLNGAGTMPATNVTTVEVDCGTTCLSLHRAAPFAPSGLYPIDPDGSGPTAGFQAYCDMTWESGGWTLLESANGTVGCGPGTAAIGLVHEGACEVMPLSAMQAMAKLSAVVHVRQSSGMAAPNTYNESTTAASFPMANLLAGKIMSFNVPQASAQAQWTVVTNLPAIVDVNCAAPPVDSNWPQVYSGCGWSYVDTLSQWTHAADAGPGTNVPMEVFVR
jgi:hypothetical protein